MTYIKSKLFITIFFALLSALTIVDASPMLESLLQQAEEESDQSEAGDRRRRVGIDGEYTAAQCISLNGQSQVRTLSDSDEERENAADSQSRVLQTATNRHRNGLNTFRMLQHRQTDASRIGAARVRRVYGLIQQMRGLQDRVEGNRLVVSSADIDFLVANINHPSLRGVSFVMPRDLSAIEAIFLNLSNFTEEAQVAFMQRVESSIVISGNFIQFRFILINLEEKKFLRVYKILISKISTLDFSGDTTFNINYFIDLTQDVLDNANPFDDENNEWESLSSLILRNCVGLFPTNMEEYDRNLNDFITFVATLPRLRVLDIVRTGITEFSVFNNDLSQGDELVDPDDGMFGLLRELNTHLRELNTHLRELHISAPDMSVSNWRGLGVFMSFLRNLEQLEIQNISLNGIAVRSPEEGEIQRILLAIIIELPNLAVLDFSEIANVDTALRDSQFLYNIIGYLARSSQNLIRASFPLGLRELTLFAGDEAQRNNDQISLDEVDVSQYTILIMNTMAGIYEGLFNGIRGRNAEFTLSITGNAPGMLNPLVGRGNN